MAGDLEKFTDEEIALRTNNADRRTPSTLPKPSKEWAGGVSLRQRGKRVESKKSLPQSQNRAALRVYEKERARRVVKGAAGKRLTYQ